MKIPKEKDDLWIDAVIFNIASHLKVNKPTAATKYLKEVIENQLKARDGEWIKKVEEIINGVYEKITAKDTIEDVLVRIKQKMGKNNNG